jgi:hypothetical protein
MKNFFDCDQIENCNVGWGKKDDLVFLNYTLSMLKSSKVPQFIFVETMKQHSPHSKGLAFDKARCAGNLKQEQCSVLLNYSARLKDSVQSFNKFISELKQLDKRVVVVAFGDHIPGIVSQIFDEGDFYNGDRHETFFTIWDSGRGYVTREAIEGLVKKSIDVAFMDVILLKYLGFESEYISTKTKFMHDCNGSFCDSQHP